MSRTPNSFRLSRLRHWGAGGWSARFWRAQDGAATIPTIIFLPFLLMIMFAGVELSILNIRQVMLERGLDETVRLLRVGASGLSENNATALEQLRTTICTRIGFIHNCKQQLMIEQYEVIRDDDIVKDAAGNATVTRNWYSNGAGRAASCTDVNLAPPVVYTLDRSVPGQIMLIRACLKIDPIMPNFGLSPLLARDANGMISLISTSAYVREPV